MIVHLWTFPNQYLGQVKLDLDNVPWDPTKIAMGRLWVGYSGFTGMNVILTRQ